MKTNKTFVQRKEDVERQWHVVDVDGKVLGRIVTEIAQLLIGKGKPTYTPHVDAGDYVVVINAAKVAVTRGKEDKKMYYSHSGYPGGLKQIVYKDLMANYPEKIITRAVKNMLPKNKFQKPRMARMKVFPTAEHSYQNKIK
jgi:large subunit ribosomal protein L13